MEYMHVSTKLIKSVNNSIKRKLLFVFIITNIISIIDVNVYV